MLKDRISIDMPEIHRVMFDKHKMKQLCKKMFKHFGKDSEMRPYSNAVVCSKISIGNNITIRPESWLFADPRPEGAGITIEDDVILGVGVHIYVNNHEFSNTNIPISLQGHSKSKQVVLKKGSWIGARVTILKGVTVGENAVVGAGSVVTRNVPPRTVCVGSPARLIKKLDS